MDSRLAPLDQNPRVQELLHLGFQRLMPAPALRPWVQSYWAIRGTLPQVSREKLYPDGGSSLIFNFIPGQEGVWFSATQQLTETELAGTLDSFGIRFHPGGAHALLQMPAEESIHLLMGQDSCDFEAVHAELMPLPTMQRIAAVERWLLRSLGRTSLGPVQRLWPALWNDISTIDALLNDTGIGRRRFERLFREHIGMAPNQLKRLLWVKKARYLIKVSPQLRLSDIAQCCGYHDQAHFVHSFKAVTGVAPGEYRARQQQRLARQEMRVEVAEHGPRLTQKYNPAAATP